MTGSTASSHLMCRSARFRHVLTALSTQGSPATESPLSLRLWGGGGGSHQQVAQVPSPLLLAQPLPGWPSWGVLGPCLKGFQLRWMSRETQGPAPLRESSSPAE